jgi:hypothetical protein
MGDKMRNIKVTVLTVYNAYNFVEKYYTIKVNIDYLYNFYLGTGMINLFDGKCFMAWNKMKCEIKKHNGVYASSVRDRDFTQKINSVWVFKNKQDAEDMYDIVKSWIVAFFLNENSN